MGLLVLPMKLAELNPETIKYKGCKGFGVIFDCPHCDCRLPVLYLNTMNGSPSVPDDPATLGNNSGFRWSRSGLTWEDLTLSPSLQIDGHGHFMVTDGLVLVTGTA